MVKTYLLKRMYLLLVLISLFIFPSDNIIKYGTIPTYLILVGFVIFFCNYPDYLKLQDFEVFWVIFLFCIAFSILFNINTVQITHIQPALLMIITYILGRSLSISTKDYQYILILFYMFLSINFLFMFLQFVFGKVIMSMTEYNMVTGISNDFHRNAFLILISSVFIQTGLILKRQIILSLIVSAICLAFMMMTASRAGIISLVCSTIFIYIFFNAKNTLVYGIKIIFLFIAFITTLLILILSEDFIIYSQNIIHEDIYVHLEIIHYRLQVFTLDSSISERFSLWISILDLEDVNLAKLLFFGLGPGSFDILNNQTMHNSLLDIFVSFGVLGLSSIMAIFYFVLKYGIRRESPEQIKALTAVIVAIIIFSMFHDYGRTRYLWFFLGLASNPLYNNFFFKRK